MSTAAKKGFMWTAAGILLAALVGAAGWLAQSHFTIASQVSAHQTQLEHVLEVHAMWQDGHSLDRRIATLEGEVKAAQLLATRITSIDEKVNTVSSELRTLTNDVSWIRKTIERGQTN